MGRTIAGLFGLAAWALSILFGLDAFGQMSRVGLGSMSALVAAVLWCGGLVVMLLSGVLSELVVLNKDPSVKN